MNVTHIKSIESVQLLRAIAAIMVLFCHAAPLIIDNKLAYEVFKQGWLGVPVFFLLSGFIIPYSMDKSGYILRRFPSFFLKRLVRIEPPYLFSILFTLLVFFTLYFVSNDLRHIQQLNIANLAGHIIYLNSWTGNPWLVEAYWTLAIEFQFYVLIALVYPLLTHSLKCIKFIFLLVLALVFVSIHLFFPSFNSQSLIVGHLASFIVGICLFLYFTKRIRFAHFLLSSIIILILQAWINGFSVAVASIITIIILLKVNKTNPQILWLGAISYSLYLTHSQMVTRFGALFVKLSILNSYLVFVLSIISCILLAYAFHIVFEKPFLRLSKTLR